jgi:hypothetical protein
MKNNHIATAVKALKRQREKFQIDRDKFEVSENSARKSKEFFEEEIVKLDAQIAELEKTLPKQKELELT